MIRILLADDQVLVRDGFRALLEREPDLEIVAEAADGVEAVELARRLRPDVILMDIRMPRLDGLAATRQLTRTDGGPKVLVLTTFDRNEWVFEALRNGASGFLLKDVRAADLVQAVRVVHAGEALLAPSVTRRLIEEFVRVLPAPRPDASLDVLTQRELEVMRLLAAGLSNTEISRELFIEPSTVKTHVNRLLGKLGLRDRTQAVVLAYESGLVSTGKGDPETSLNPSTGHPIG